MRIEDYNDFYDKVIKQCIDGIMKYAENLQFDSGIQVRDNSKDKIYKNYQKKRDYVRSNYMSKKTEVSLDRHKVSSCMIYAILNWERQNSSVAYKRDMVVKNMHMDNIQELLR